MMACSCCCGTSVQLVFQAAVGDNGCAWRVEKHSILQHCSCLSWLHGRGTAAQGMCWSFHGIAGIDDPYEEPENAELVLEALDKEGKHVTPQVSAAKILEYLHAKHLI